MRPSSSRLQPAIEGRERALRLLRAHLHAGYVARPRAALGGDLVIALSAVPFAVDDWAIGQGLGLAIKYGISTVKKIWAEQPYDRLLLLMHWEFHERCGISLADFQVLGTDQHIREPLQSLLDGKQLDPAALAKEIAKHFPDHADSEALGVDMAAATGRLAAFARDGSEAEAAISRQLEDGFAQVIALFSHQDRRLDEIEEQIAGLHRKMDVRLPDPSAPTGPHPPGPRAPAAGAVEAPIPERGRLDPDAQAGAAELLRRRVEGGDAPELAAAFTLARNGQHTEAAAAFAEQAVLFERQHLSELAEECRESQARALEAAGEADAAREVRIMLVGHQIERGSDLGLLGARKLLHTATDEEAWRYEALLAQADWPEQPDAAMKALERAAQLAEGDEALGFAAAATEVLVIFGQSDRALRVAARFRKAPLAEGLRLRLELDALDAVERTGRGDDAETGWQALLSWAQEQESTAAQATVMARRGTCLARREQLDDAVAAYWEALALWTQVPGYEDQVAEMFWAVQSAGGLMGQFRPPLAELRTTASALRGSVQSPAARADALETRGMQARFNEKLFDAVRCFWLALAIHRRNGNLRGVLYDSEMLGQVLAVAERPAAAAACLVQAGREDRAAEAAMGARPDELVAALSLDGPRWERAASYAVLGRVGRRLPPEVVAELAETVLSEAEQPFGGLISPQPANRAREAVAGLVLGLPAEHQQRALRILRTAAETHHPTLAKRAAQALLLATNAGLSDETEFLIERYLDEPAMVGVTSPWVAARLEVDPSARARVEQAARDGSAQALEALAITAERPDDPDLQAQAAARIERTLEALAEAEPTHSVGIGGYEDLGIAARLGPAPLREQLADALLALAGDARYPEPNRRSAAYALFNLGSALALPLRARLIRSLLPLAAGNYELSRWDDSALNGRDPLARFRISFGEPGELQAAALHAAGALADDALPLLSLSDRDRLAELLYAARLDQRANVAAAAYEALARIPEAASTEAVEVGLAHADPGVRAAALRAWMAKTAEPPPAILNARLLLDPDLNVRLVFLNLAAELGLREVVEAFCEDPDAYVRAWAVTRLTA